LGCLVRRAGEIYILSNNHVLASSNNARLGDAILQPGAVDGGTVGDQLATLADFVPLAFNGTTPPPAAPPSGCSPLGPILGRMGVVPPAGVLNVAGDNKVDCAIARPMNPSLLSPDILNIGVPVGPGTAGLGTPVQKFGRTTGYTRGSILQIDLTASINYGGRNAVFTGQLMAGAMSQGGDSGSAVLDMDSHVVGLLFAGSASTTIINPIQMVLTALNAQIVNWA
jgi:hypothetical protein